MFHPRHPNIYRAQYVTCGGGHVRKVASMWCVFGTAASLVGVVVAMYNLCGIQFGVVVPILLIHVSVLLADKFEVALLYLPYLIISAMLLVLGALSVIGFCVLLFVPPDKYYYILNPDIHPTADFDYDQRLEKQVAVMILLFLILASTVMESVGIYFWMIVRKAWLYMLHEVRGHRIHVSVADMENPIRANGKWQPHHHA